MCPTRTVAARRALAVLLALALAAPAHAQFFTPPPASLLIDTSIRSAAMGGAGAAVTWGEPGVWANPATLAGVRGVGWVTGHTHVLPGLEDAVVFDSQRLLIGGGGLGFSLMGTPISGLGKAKLEYPPIALPLGGQGDPPYDLTEGWGVGGSPLRLIESFRKVTGMRPRALTTYGDIMVGYQGKKSTAQPDPNVAPLPEATTYDWGIAGKLALARFWGGDAPFRLDLSGAYSDLNHLKSESDAPATAATEIERYGFALRLAPALPSRRASSPPSMPWWRPGDLQPLSIGLAYDHEQRHEEPFPGPTSNSEHYGFEALVFRMLALRAGYLSDPDDPNGSVEGWSYGGGVTLPIGHWGSVGYQLASVPLQDGVDRQFRQGWSLWLDPTRFWSDER